MAPAVVEQDCHPESVASGAVFVSVTRMWEISVQLPTVIVTDELFEIAALVLASVGAVGAVESIVNALVVIDPLFPAESTAVNFNFAVVTLLLFTTHELEVELADKSVSAPN